MTPLALVVSNAEACCGSPSRIGKEEVGARVRRPGHRRCPGQNGIHIKNVGDGKSTPGVQFSAQSQIQTTTTRRDTPAIADRIARTEASCPAMELWAGHDVARRCLRKIQAANNSSAKAAKMSSVAIIKTRVSGPIP